MASDNFIDKDTRALDNREKEALIAPNRVNDKSVKQCNRIKQIYMYNLVTFKQEHAWNK